MIINSRHDKSMPMNSEVLFDVSMIIKPKKLVVPYYTLGTENVAWVNGRSIRGGARSKEADHLYLMAEEDGTTSAWSCSTVLVDLTNIKALFIDWENTGDGNNGNETRLQVSTDERALPGNFVAELEYNSDFVRRVDELDVSTVSGEYHIIVYASDGTDPPTKSEVRTYRVWGEG